MIYMDIEKLIKKFGGKWVALSDDSKKVVASSKSAKLVFDKAKKEGYGAPKLFKVPAENLPYIGNAI
jgi:hypothetical protein